VTSADKKESVLAAPALPPMEFCCDAFSAMTTDRPYRKARPAEVAELRRCAGTHFDPKVVEALARVI
jgi:hypothetical protein